MAVKPRRAYVKHVSGAARTSQARAAMRQSQARSAAVAARRGGIVSQSIRTGGWTNPSGGKELKFIDVAAAPAPNAAAVTFANGVLLNGCIQGTEAVNRIGRKIHMKSLYMRYSLRMAATSTLGGCIRILVVYDKQANATAPAITDVLLEDAFRSPNNLSNRDRFVVLVDHISEPISATGNYEVGDVIYRKINLESMFNTGNAGTVGDMTSGSVYLFVAQSGAIGTAGPGINVRSRIKFTDV